MGEPFGDSATQRKAEGGRIYGGGGSGGGGGNQTSTQITDLPDWAKPYAKEGLGKAAALTDTTQNPYQTYDQSRQAGFTGLQNQAFTGAQNMGPSAAMGTAANMAGTAGLGALNAGQTLTLPDGSVRRSNRSELHEPLHAKCGGHPATRSAANRGHCRYWAECAGC